jgi:DNA-binding NtrC family response regulator
MATVLILEDDIDVRALCAFVLKRDGHSVLEAGTVDEAEQCCTIQAIELLVANIVLPGGKSGTSFSRALIKAQPHVRVLFISGWPEARGFDLDNLRNLPEHSFRVLQKPFNIDTFLRQVHHLLNGSKPKSRRQQSDSA